MDEIQKFLAVDIETTDLDPREGIILEIYAVPLNETLTQCGNAFHGILGISPDKIPTLSDFIKEMHGPSGTNLLSTPANCTMAEVEHYLNFNSGKDIHLLGSSVEFDKKWLGHYFPSVKFHYRVCNVSSFKLLYPVQVSETSVAHRAKDDVEYSIRLARAYRKLIMRGLD